PLSAAPPPYPASSATRTIYLPSFFQLSTFHLSAFSSPLSNQEPRTKNEELLIPYPRHSRSYSLSAGSPGVDPRSPGRWGVLRAGSEHSGAQPRNYFDVGSSMFNV